MFDIRVEFRFVDPLDRGIDVSGSAFASVPHPSLTLSSSLLP